MPSIDPDGETVVSFRVAGNTTVAHSITVRKSVHYEDCPSCAHGCPKPANNSQCSNDGS